MCLSIEIERDITAAPIKTWMMRLPPWTDSRPLFPLLNESDGLHVFLTFLVRNGNK